MLLASAIVAVLLGYTQWRRQSILRESHALEADGFPILWNQTQSSPDWKRSLPDWLWPVVPDTAAATYHELPGNQVRFGSNIYAESDFTQKWRDASDRLRALGVEFIRCDRNGTSGDSCTSTHYGQN